MFFPGWNGNVKKIHPYAIVDVINKLFVLIEDEDIKSFVQQKLQENGCEIFRNTREAFNRESR